MRTGLKTVGEEIRKSAAHKMEVSKASSARESGGSSPGEKSAKEDSQISGASTGSRSLRVPTKVSKTYSVCSDIVGQTHGTFFKNTSVGHRSKLPLSPDKRKVLMLNKAKEPEAPNFRQEEETNDDRENSGDSTLVNFDKLEFTDERQEKIQQKVVDKPETHDKSVQTMETSEMEKTKTASENDTSWDEITLMDIFISLIFIAACIAYIYA